MELLDIKNYRANESQYTSDIDVMDIVLGIKSWHDAKKTHIDSGEIVSDFEDDDDESAGATYKPSKMRREYTFEERKAIVKYIVKYRRYMEVKGRSLWVDMEKAKVCPHRSWESMKEHFRKVIVHRINEFDVDVSTAKKLCRLYLTPSEMKSRFSDSSSKEEEEQANSSARAPDLQCSRVGSIEEVDENNSNEMRYKGKNTDDVDHTEPVKRIKLREMGTVNNTNHYVNEASSNSATNTNTEILYQINEKQPISTLSSPDRSVAMRDISSENENNTTNMTPLQLSETQPFSVNLSPNTSETTEEDNGELSPVINVSLQDIFTFQKEAVTQENNNRGESFPAESIVLMDCANSGKDIPAAVSISIEDRTDHRFIHKSMSETLPSAAHSQDMQKIPLHNSSNTKKDGNNAITSTVQSNNSHSCISQISSETAQNDTIQDSIMEEDSDKQNQEMLLPLGIPINIKEELPDISDTETLVFSSEEEYLVHQERIKENLSDSGAELYSSEQEMSAERTNFCHEMLNLPQKRGYQEDKERFTKNSIKSNFQCRKSGIENESDSSVSSDEVVIRRPRINRKLHLMQHKCTARFETKKSVVLLKRLDLNEYERISRNGIYSYIIDDSCHSEPDGLQINTRNKVNISNQDFIESYTDEEVIQKMLSKRTTRHNPKRTHKEQMTVDNSSDSKHSDDSSCADSNDDAFEIPESDSSIHICEDDQPKGSSKTWQSRFYRIYEDVAILNYIHRTRSYSRVGGVQLWKEMESSGIIKDRSWHSLKERYRKVLVKNLKKYAKNGVTKAVIAKFEKRIKKTEPKDGADVLKINYIRTYTREEDLCILDFIRRTNRYHGVAGKVLWELMSSTDPVLRGRTWQSLKERFRKIIVKNLERYEIPEKEKKLFEEPFRTRKGKSYNHRRPIKGCTQKHYTQKNHFTVDSSNSEDGNSEDSDDAYKVQHRKARGGRIKKLNINTDENVPNITFQRKKKKLFTSNDLFCDSPVGIVPNKKVSRRVENMTTTAEIVDYPHMADISSSVVPAHSSHISTNIPCPEETDHPQSRSDSTSSKLEEPVETKCAEAQEVAATSSNEIIESNLLEGNQIENVEERHGTRMETESIIPEPEGEDRHNCSEEEGKDESTLTYKRREEHSGNPSEQEEEDSRFNCSQQEEKDGSSLNHEGREEHSGSYSEQEEEDRHNCSQQEEKDGSSLNHEGREEYSGSYCEQEEEDSKHNCSQQEEKDEEYSDSPPESVDTSQSGTEALPGSSKCLESGDCRMISYNISEVRKSKDSKKNIITLKGSRGTASASRGSNFKSRFSDKEYTRHLRSMMAGRTTRKRKIRKLELKGTGKII
ncbi:uncharacterized protein LOC143035818 isoform X2 [Oratosquilla oratoria]